MAQLRQGCLWEQLTPERPVSPRLIGDRTADVCVIGGGFTGLSAALRLLEGGKTVCVVEAHQVGHGGSGRNVGLVNAGTWVAPDDLDAVLGSSEAARLNTALGGAPALVFATIDKYGIQCEDTRTGNLHMAHNAKGVSDLRSRAEQWQRRGARLELLTGKACEDACGTDKVAAALLDHRAGTLNPMAYVAGMAVNVQARDGVIFGDSPVTGLQRTDDGWKVSTEHGSVRAEKVIIASNAYTEGEWTDIKDHIFAGYYYQVASVPLSGPAQETILPGRQGSWDTRTVLSSIRRDAHGRLVLGSLGNGGNYPLWFIRQWADRIQQHYFPALGKVEWETTWTGRIGFTPDHLLRLIEPAPGLLAATGFNGRGVTTGTLVGKCFADYLLTGDSDALPVNFTRSPKVAGAGLRTLAYDAGFTLYHAGQCLRVVL